MFDPREYFRLTTNLELRRALILTDVPPSAAVQELRNRGDGEAMSLYDIQKRMHEAQQQFVCFRRTRISYAGLYKPELSPSFHI